MEFYSKLFGKDVEKLSRKETMEMYKTPFLIWANYEIEEKEDVHISSNYLSTLMMETAGMEMPPLNRFLAQLCEEVPILTSNGYYGDDGKLYILNDKSLHITKESVNIRFYSTTTCSIQGTESMIF